MASTSMVAEAHSSKQRFVSSTVNMKVLLFHLQWIVDVEPFSHFYYNHFFSMYCPKQPGLPRELQTHIAFSMFPLLGINLWFKASRGRKAEKRKADLAASKCFLASTLRARAPYYASPSSILQQGSNSYTISPFQASQHKSILGESCCVVYTI